VPPEEGEEAGLDGAAGEGKASGQGLTLVHFSAQPEPFLKQKITMHTP
jgi:hypothetical protein